MKPTVILVAGSRRRCTGESTAETRITVGWRLCNGGRFVITLISQLLRYIIGPATEDLNKSTVFKRGNWFLHLFRMIRCRVYRGCILVARWSFGSDLAMRDACPLHRLVIESQLSGRLISLKLSDII